MKKISLWALACFFNILSLFAQSNVTPSLYEKQPLKMEEANFVSSYYGQNGNHSAVTGGIGTEKLSDFANTFDLKLAAKTKKGLKHTFNLDFGVDHYTSASSDNIATPAQQAASWGTTTTTTATTTRKGKGRNSTSASSSAGTSTTNTTSASSSSNNLTSASRSDTRFYPSLSWSIKNESTGIQVGASAAYSKEYDYESRGGSLMFSKTSKDQSRELGLKLQAFFDTWMVIYPHELTPAGYGDGSHWSTLPVSYKPRNSYEAGFSLSQVINQKLQIAFLLDLAYQEGLLATKYQRVYFNDATVHSETLPDTKFKLPIGVRANYFLGDRVILRSFYRFYRDNWGVSAHTASLETPIKISPFVSISPFYRFYTQQGSKYFAPYKAHTAADEFYTSDYDLSTFKSHYVGTGIRLSPPEGVFGWQRLNMIEIRYGHYMRTDGLASNAISMNLRFK